MSEKKSNLNPVPPPGSLDHLLVKSPAFYEFVGNCRTLNARFIKNNTYLRKQLRLSLACQLIAIDRYYGLKVKEDRIHDISRFKERPRLGIMLYFCILSGFWGLNVFEFGAFDMEAAGYKLEELPQYGAWKEVEAGRYKRHGHEGKKRTGKRANG